MKKPTQRRTKLLSEVEMNARFARITAPDVIARERSFYGYLTSHAEKEVGARELVLIMTIAITEHYPESMAAVSMKDHVDAMLGEGRSANQVKEEFFDIMFGVAEIQKKRREGTAHAETSEGRLPLSAFQAMVDEHLPGTNLFYMLKRIEIDTDGEYIKSHVVQNLKMMLKKAAEMTTDNLCRRKFQAMHNLLSDY